LKRVFLTKPFVVKTALPKNVHKPVLRMFLNTSSEKEFVQIHFWQTKLERLSFYLNIIFVGNAEIVCSQYNVGEWQ
jgi:hypothetical protein